MKKIIRRNTFETNSSSSHSLVIGKRTKPVLDYFPRNSEYIYHLEEYGRAYCDDYTPDIARLYSEVDKARFMLNIIASHIEDDDDCEGNHYPEVIYWLDYDNRIENPNRTFETLIEQKPFVWLKEVLESYTGIEFKFVEPDSNYFPYYGRVYDEDRGLDEVADIDFFNEEKFKERVAEIIFNEEIVIVDADIPYGCDIDLEDYV